MLRSWRVLLFHLSAATVLVVATAVVPLPVTEIAPAPATPIRPLIDIDPEQITELNGRTLLTAVYVSRATTAELVRGLLDPAVSLEPGTELGGLLRDEYFEAEQVRFQRSFDLAVAVGARRAGVDVELESAAFVSAVLPDAPASGALEPGDLIVAVAGEQVTSARQLQRRLDAVGPDREVVVTVRRDGRDRDVRLSPGTYRFRGRTETGFGILIETIAERVVLPFDLSHEQTDIGGPSAGMMIALTVYDLLAEEDLLAGRSVAGTGEIRPGGAVASVGEIAAKVVGAERDGAEVFLVPSDQLAAASAAARDIEVVGVDDLDGAITALRRS